MICMMRKAMKVQENLQIQRQGANRDEILGDANHEIFFDDQNGTIQSTSGFPVRTDAAMYFKGEKFQFIDSESKDRLSPIDYGISPVLTDASVKSNTQQEASLLEEEIMIYQTGNLISQQAKGLNTYMRFFLIGMIVINLRIWQIILK